MAKQDDPRTIAGMVAAAGPVVAKQIPLRIPPTNLSAHLRPSTLADLPRLFRTERENHANRVSRLSAAALLYSVDKDHTETSSRVLVGRERTLLEDLYRDRRPHSRTDRSCPHCRLLFKTVYDDVEQRQALQPPIAVVGHSARVDIKFDPESNISEARINNYQVIVPREVARDLIRLSHPLRWTEPPGSFFHQCDPVNARGEPLDALKGSPEQIIAAWNTLTGEQFIFENCVWPINENFSTVSENIIAFDNFEHTDGASLNYTYRLQRSLRSNFGVAWERGGFDVDSGFYQALAVPVEDFRYRASDNLGKDGGSTIPDTPLPGMPTGQLKRRDVLALWERLDKRALQDLYCGASPPGDEAAKTNDYAGWVLPGVKPSVERVGGIISNTAVLVPAETDPDKTDSGQVADVVEEVARKMAMEWPKAAPFYVVNISASKRLHFTIPENGPIELWHLMTWMAPAFLFTFLNNCICLAPHVMVGDLIKPGTKD
jgi:hypothetical protein